VAEVFGVEGHHVAWRACRPQRRAWKRVMYGPTCTATDAVISIKTIEFEKNEC